jgi:hypothetical protein
MLSSLRLDVRAPAICNPVAAAVLATSDVPSIVSQALTIIKGARTSTKIELFQIERYNPLVWSSTISISLRQD